MRVLKAGYEIIDELNGAEILKKLEKIARVCYKSEEKITQGSAERMVRALIKNGHEAMLEHYSFSVKFIVDRCTMCRPADDARYARSDRSRGRAD